MAEKSDTVKKTVDPIPEKTAKKDKAIDAAVKDPTVQKFMKTFKAQILSVEQIKGKKK